MSSEVDYWLDFYLREGFSVIPICPKGKRPVVRWEEYQHRRPTQAELDEWRRRYWRRGYNIAVIAGAVSGNLFVLDFERLEYFFEFFSKPDEVARRTFCVETPSGGVHVYFRSPEPLRSTKVVGKLDLQAEGKYVVAPPSVAKSKLTGELRKYEKLPPSPLKVLELSDPDLGSKVVKYAAERLGASVASSDWLDEARKALGEKAYRGRVPPCFKKLIEEGAREGFRNEATIRLASWLLAWRKWKPDRALRFVLRWNRERNRPPLSDDEVRRTFESALKHGYRYGCRGMSVYYCNRWECPLRPREVLAEGWP